MLVRLRLQCQRRYLRKNTGLMTCSINRVTIDFVAPCGPATTANLMALAMLRKVQIGYHPVIFAVGAGAVLEAHPLVRQQQRFDYSASKRQDA